MKLLPGKASFNHDALTLVPEALIFLIEHLQPDAVASTIALPINGVRLAPSPCVDECALPFYILLHRFSQQPGSLRPPVLTVYRRMQ